MPLTPGITQPAALLNSLALQTVNSRNMPDPETVASPGNTVMLTERTPVLRQLSSMPYGGADVGDINIRTVTGSIVSVSDAIRAPVISLLSRFYPVQSDSGEVRPISGWTGLNVYRTGKNIFPVTDVGVSSDTPLFFPGSINVTVSCLANNTPQFIYTNKSGVADYWTLSQTSGGRKYRSFRSEEFVAYRINGGAYDAQLELGSTATAFEPYTGTTYPIDWTTEAGTVYGGCIDITNGVLYSEWVEISSYNGEQLPGEWMSSLDTYAPGTLPTIGAQVVYKTAEPVIIQLAPTEITMLSVINNIWADTNGDITAVYAAV